MIEIEGLPEGRKIVQFQDSPDTENHQGYITALCDDGSLWSFSSGSWSMFPLIPIPVKPEKTQPRRIVLEEISKEEYYRLFNDELTTNIFDMAGSFWREVIGVSQRDGAEPKLSLSVDECRNVRSLIKDFENLGWFVNPAISLLLQKITKFIKENS